MDDIPDTRRSDPLPEAYEAPRVTDLGDVGALTGATGASPVDFDDN
jgi:hypothetical protein